MNEWTFVHNKLILDANSMSKLIGKYVTIIVYVYNQAFKVVVNLVSTLDAGFSTNMALPMQKKIFGVQRGIFI